MQPVNLLHFAEDSDTSGYFPQLARWHDRSRYRMHFGTLKPMAPWLREFMLDQGVSCFSCECKSRKSYPLGLAKLADYLRREKIAVLHTHLFDPSVVGLTAGVLARTPLRVMTRHYSDYHTRINKTWHVKLDQMCNRFSHAIIAVSEHTAEHLIGVEKADAKKVVTVLNGIDFERVKVSDLQAPGALREQYLGLGGGHLLLIVGRLHPEKGYEFLFPALKELGAMVRGPVKLLVAGKGPLLDSYQQMVRALGMEDRVEFLGYRKDVADLMAAADLVVLPSVAEACGLVLTEALYLGTPVVATRVGGIPEIVTDGVNGLLVPPGDNQALAAGIASLLNDPERRARMAGSGREKVVEQFQFRDMVRAYEEVYEKYSSSKQVASIHA
jgi:glycosyltransferase involved in cell wall biosynthesis